MRDHLLDQALDQFLVQCNVGSGNFVYSSIPDVRLMLLGVLSMQRLGHHCQLLKLRKWLPLERLLRRHHSCQGILVSPMQDQGKIRYSNWSRN